MMEIWEIISSTFRESKEAGSYMLFYLLALGLGLAVAWDRYGKAEMENKAETLPVEEKVSRKKRTAISPVRERRKK